LFERQYQGRLFVGDKQACGTQSAPGHPRARASSGLSGIVGQPVELDGSASLFGDGSDTLSRGLPPGIARPGPTRGPPPAHPRLVPDVSGRYVVRLDVGRDVDGHFEVADATMVWVEVSEAPGTVHFARDVVPLFGPDFGKCQDCHKPPSPPNGFDLTGSTAE